MQEIVLNFIFTNPATKQESKIVTRNKLHYLLCDMKSLLHQTQIKIQKYAAEAAAAVTYIIANIFPFLL